MNNKNENNFKWESMKYLVFIMILFFIVSCKTMKNGHNNKSEPSIQFKNQGEQENYWAKQFFDINYEKSEYAKFIGKVTITNSEIQFGLTEFIIYSNSNQKYNLIFEKGLLYPGLLMRDTLDLCCIKELTFLSDNPKIKRFCFLLTEKFGNVNILNPSVYLFELYNENATKDDTWEVFIENAKLTFIKYGWSQL